MSYVVSLGLGIAALVTVGLLYASPAGLAQGPGPNPRAGLVSGRGTTALHRFEFGARARNRASMTVYVLGRAVFQPLTVRSSPQRITITCLSILRNRAVLGGHLSGARGVSRGALFSVEDNGRGDRVDRISRLLLRPAPPKSCPRPEPLDRSALRVRGDIVVQGG